MPTGLAVNTRLLDRITSIAILDVLRTSSIAMETALANTNALATLLSEWPQPVISDYELGCMILRVSEAPLTRARYTELVELLGTVKLITPHKDFAEGAVYTIFGKTDAMPAAIACSADPFAYLSHLSAMEFHGITDRLPKTLYLCTPPSAEWSREARSRMEKELGPRLQEYTSANLPVLRNVLKAKIGHSTLSIMRRSKMGAFKIVKGRAIRVATIARTFLDMLREPENCGGMQHVVDTYKEYASSYLTQICNEIDQHGSAVDKVRAGYLLTEVCGLHHETIDSWRKFAQRGGSRKLDPHEEYANHYSDGWKLSINVPSLAANNSGDE